MLPPKQGLYDPRFEHDACGVSFVADLHGRASHRMVELGLRSLCNLDHRGATNAEVNVGDGAGILIQVPDAFLREVAGFDLPPAGSYATGIGFLPRDPEAEAAARTGIEKIAASEGLQVLGWRDVPIDNAMIGQQAADAEPSFRQVFITTAEGQPQLSGIELDRRCFVVRKRVEHELGTGDEGGRVRVLGWREVPIDNTMIGQQAADAEPSFRQVFLTSAEGHRRSPASTSTAGASSCASAWSTSSETAATACTSRASRPAPSCTRGCSLRPGRRVLPRPRATSGSSRPSPSCTAASPPTRSRRGPSPTRTGSSPTTARSTP